MKKSSRILLATLLMFIIGSSIFIFTSCDEIIGNIIDQVLPHEHTMVEGDVLKEPTCTDSGLREKICIDCGYIDESEVLAALGHTEETVTGKAATCTEAGLTDGKKCSVCGETLVAQEVVSATGHKYEDSNCCHTCGNIDTSYFNFELIDNESYSVSAKNRDNMPSIVVIPSVYNGKDVTKIGMYSNAAFSMCHSITRVIIPDSVTHIDNWAFSRCYNLSSVVIGENVTYIGEGAFYSCSSLKTITIPAKACLGGRALDDCISLESILVAPDHRYYTSIDGNLYENQGTQLIQYALGKKDTKFIVPEGVTRINHYAISGAKNLETIILNDGIATIGTAAFAYCSSLKEIVIPNSVESIGIYGMNFAESGSLHIFTGCENLIGIYYEGSEVEWNNINIQEEYINSNPFENCLYFYSTNQPTEEGNFWHWVDGEPVAW